MSGHGEKMSRNKERAIGALLSTPSIVEAAKSIGIGEASLRRWLQLKNFQEAYQAARRELVKHALTNMQCAMSEAVGTLKAVMLDSKTPPSSRVAAAKAIFDFGLKSAEFLDLAERVSALEKQAEARGDR